MVFVKRLLCLACVLTFVCVETSITTPASEQGHVANKLRTLAFLPPANISGNSSRLFSLSSASAPLCHVKPTANVAAVVAPSWRAKATANAINTIVAGLSYLVIGCFIGHPRRQTGRTLTRV